MADPTRTDLGHAREAFWNSDQRSRIQANDDLGDPQDLLVDEAERLKVNAFISEVGPLTQELAETNRLLRKLVLMFAAAFKMNIPDDPGTL